MSMPTRRTFLTQSAAAGLFAAGSIRLAAAASPGAGAGPKTPMKTYKIPQTDLVVSRIAYGCAGLAPWGNEPLSAADLSRATTVINTAYDNGVTLFDHADIYAGGKAETVFGQILKQSPGLREKIVLQSKCGQKVMPGGVVHADLSRAHIVGAVEGSLRRLGTDRLDLLLLHIADSLVEPDEVAQAFDALHRGGKVRYFGVSNHNATQIQLLKKSVRQPLVANQIHLGLGHPDALSDGMEFTAGVAKSARNSGDGHMSVSAPGTIDYCRLHDIQVQAWSPLRGGLLNPPADASPELKQTAQLLAEMARNKNATPASLALAWLLRHPAGIVPITGASRPEHIVENCAADRVELSRDEWYSLFAAATDLKSRAL
jgi:predicted oxidoreductase